MLKCLLKVETTSGVECLRVLCKQICFGLLNCETQRLNQKRPNHCARALLPFCAVHQHWPIQLHVLLDHHASSGKEAQHLRLLLLAAVYVVDWEALEDNVTLQKGTLRHLLVEVSLAWTSSHWITWLNEFQMVAMRDLWDRFLSLGGVLWSFALQEIYTQ